MSANTKSTAVDYVETTEDHTAVMSPSQVLTDFEARQHSLTRKQAIKENWKAIAWCMVLKPPFSSS
jgi:hypothetical protein